MDDARKLCAENDPGSEYWSEASFVGQLTEDGVFDRALYERLASAIAAVGEASTNVDDVWSLLRILERVTLLIGAHLDPADVYRISDLTHDDVADFNNEFRNLLRELSFQTRSGKA